MTEYNKTLDYKYKKVLAPYCKTCNEFLHGDNSVVSPYICSCGVWKSSYSNPLNFKISPLTNKKSTQL